MPGLSTYYTPCEHVCLAQPSERVSYQPGDFILVKGGNWYSRLIQFGQSLRFTGKNKPFAYWTHVALIVSSEGDLVEALASGVKQTNIADYDTFLYAHVAIQASNEDRNEVVAFGKACIGQEYDWLTILSIAISLLTGSKISIGLDGQEVCSGLVSRALERTTAIFPRDASHIAPAMLAQFYGVSLPS